MSIYFYGLIVLTGILTIYTDICQRKIKNAHLLFIGSLALLLYFILFLSGNLKMSIHLILNPIAGLVIGFLFYLSGLWKPGDAKLFATYSLLLPANGYSAILPLSCFTLFINTFLLSFLFLLPLSIYGIIHNKTMVFKKAAIKKVILFFGQIFFITFCVSWVIQPIMAFLPLQNNIFLNFILLFGGYLLISKCLGRISKFLIVFIMIAGLALRYIVMPYSFSVDNFFSYLRYMLVYSIIFYILTNIVYLKEQKPMRISFSPFVFLGALLTNTDFLWWVIKLPLAIK